MRLKMDWILFWTILALVSFGLVMVYSASSVVQELKRPAAAAADSGADEAAETARAVPVFTVRRVGAAVVGLIAALFVLRKYREGVLSMSWAAGGAAGILFLQVLAYWMEADKTPHYALLVRQAGAALAGFFALMYISQRDYRELRSAQWAFSCLGVVMFLLIVVYFADSQHRWLRVGISIQPSELAKPALVVFLAWFVTRRSPGSLPGYWTGSAAGAGAGAGGSLAPDINHRHTLWPAALALAAVAGAVAIPDVGTAIVLVATAAAVFYLAGLRWRYTLAALGVGLVLLSAAIISKPYRVKRVIDFTDPDYSYLSRIDTSRRLLHYAESGSKIQDTRHQAIQSTIAIGAGGVWGRGLMQSRQKLLFLPEAHNDYIYAIVAEELGLWGPTLLLGGFLVILWRGYRLFWTASDDFGRYLAVGVTTTLVFQALLNMSVVLDLGPTKGIPLPLISFGGSSLISSLVLLGLLLSVSQRSSH